MILECPRCDTRFLVPSHLIPREGREVKCARCAEQWHAMPDADELPPMQENAPINQAEASPARDDAPAYAGISDEQIEEIERRVEAQLPEDMPEDPSSADYDIPFSPHLPALSEEKTFKPLPLIIGALILLIAVSAVALFAFRQQLQPSAPGFYTLLGMPDVRGLALADVVLRERPSRSQARLVVEGKIVNESDEERSVPILRVTIADKAGETVISREYEAEPGETIAPGAAYEFKAGRLDTTYVDRVDHLIVEIGGGVSLMLTK